MKNLLLFLIMLSASLSFFSCDPKKQDNLIESFRLPVYKQGDTLIYKSGSNYDTFVYIEQGIYFTEIDENYRQQSIWYSIQNKKDTSNYGGINHQFNFTGISWQNKIMMIIGPESKPDTSSLKINGQEYMNVFFNKLPLNDTAKKYPTQIYFTYKYWVIRYIMNDSSTWDLVSH